MLAEFFVSSGLLAALENVANPNVLLAIFGGSLVGIVFGVIPGLGGIQAMTLALPFTFSWDPVVAMYFYAGIMGTVAEGGTTPAILLNTPGTPPNAATALEGYPMTRRGEAGRALGLATTSSVLGALFGVVILIGLLPLVRPIVLAFGSPELFWLIVAGIIAIVVAARGSLAKGIAAGGVGLLLSLIGFSDTFGVVRFAPGGEYLWDGLPLVPFMIGLFAISEMLVYTTAGGTIVQHGTAVVTVGLRAVAAGAREMFRYPWTFIRGSLVGTLVGIIPGIGASAATFISYSLEKQICKRGSEFGTGVPEGLIAPEAAQNAKDGGSLLPTVAFGVPGSPEMAVLLGAFILHGLAPGPLLIRDHMEVVWALVLGLTLSQVFAGAYLFFAAPLFSRLTVLDTRLLGPAVLVLSLVGAYVTRENVWDVGVCVLIGLFAYALRRGGFSLVPLAMGFVLGQLAENAYQQSLQSSYGSHAILFTRPVCMVLIAFNVLFLGYAIYRELADRRTMPWLLRLNRPDPDAERE